MEEILASIRRIISDDGEPPPQRDEADNDGAEAEAEALSDEKFSREFEPEDDPEEEAEAEAEAEARPAADPEEEEEVADEPVEDDRSAEDADSDDDEGEVFELTEVVAEEAETATEDDDDIYHAAEVAFAEAAREPDPPAAPRPREAYAGPLMSEGAEASAAAAFGALTSQLRSRSGGGRTLEEIAEDLLRPMLQAWLDENLPPLVEQLVREEIERLSRRAK